MIIVIGFFIAIKSQFPIFKLSSNGMSPELNVGDVVLVNSLFKKKILKRNEIHVFSCQDENKISRIVGLPGDEIQFIDGVLFVNNIEKTGINTCFMYNLIIEDNPPLEEHDLLLLLEPLSQFGECKAILTEAQFEVISKLKFVKSIRKIIHSKGYEYKFLDNPIFPNDLDFNWTRDNFGPITIPNKGDFIGDSKFVVKNNYYFVLGDNRVQSIDSRYLGLISERDVVGRLISKIYSASEKN